MDIFWNTISNGGRGGRLKPKKHRRFLSQQLNAIFVAPKLQLQNRTCKPLCDFRAILAIYRRGMRWNLRNTVTLSSIFTFEEARSFCLRSRRVLTFTLITCTKITMKLQLVATSARQKFHWIAATKITCVNGPLERVDCIYWYTPFPLQVLIWSFEVLPIPE